MHMSMWPEIWKILQNFLRTKQGAKAYLPLYHPPAAAAAGGTFLFTETHTILMQACSNAITCNPCIVKASRQMLSARYTWYTESSGCWSHPCLTTRKPITTEASARWRARRWNPRASWPAPCPWPSRLARTGYCRRSTSRTHPSPAGGVPHSM